MKFEGLWQRASGGPGRATGDSGYGHTDTGGLFWGRSFLYIFSIHLILANFSLCLIIFCAVLFLEAGVL